MEQILIQYADTSHAEFLSRLGKETFYEWFTEPNNPEDVRNYAEHAFSLQQMNIELNEVGSVFLMAFDGKTPAGYAKLRLSEEVEFPGKKSIELQRLYTTKDYIGKGVGAMLLQRCLDEAKRLGYDVMWLGVWEKNAKAISFYEKWGFEQFSSHTFMLGNDKQTDNLMKLEIS
jgi:GNAT superfamily N-acetyltransferase